MKYLKIATIVVAVFVLTGLINLAGCIEDRRSDFHGDRDRAPERHEGQDNDRHDGGGRDSAHEGEHDNR
jgi:hypothetical protein